MRIYALVLLLVATTTGAQEYKQTRAAIFKTNAHSCADFSPEVYTAIRSMPFPDDWTVVVTCNDYDWQNWLAKSKYPRIGGLSLGITSERRSHLRFSAPFLGTTLVNETPFSVGREST
jgi:hypothetical protein